MSHEGMPIEYEDVIEKPHKRGVDDSILQETTEEKKVDLEEAYRLEVARYKVEHINPQKKIWESLEKRAADNNWYVREACKEYTSRPTSIIDKIRRKALSLQARIEGVEDINKFQQFVDYIESTVTEREHIYLKLPKGLSEERKEHEIQKWVAKGYKATSYNFSEDDRHTYFRPEREVPFKLKMGQVKLLKGLISPVNNPVEIAEHLTKIGFRFSEYTFSLEDYATKLGDLFKAPHVKEALKKAQGIDHWGNEWFPALGPYERKPYERKPCEVGQLDFLIQLSQAPDLDSVFPNELIKKINTLSGALRRTVTVPEIKNLEAIANDPNYLELASIITQETDVYSRAEIPVLENMQALDKAGVLGPLLALRHTGVDIGAGELNDLFRGYMAIYNPQENQKAITARLQEKLLSPGINEFIQDPSKQEFVSLLVHITGQFLSVYDLESLEDLFGKELDKRNEALYLTRLFYENIGKEDKLSLEHISNILKNNHVSRTFTDHKFPEFLKDLKTKMNFKISGHELHSNGGSMIVTVFNDTELRQALLQEETTKIIKALNSSGRNIDLRYARYYVTLSQVPNALRTINVLNDLGYHLDNLNNELEIQTMEKLGSSSDSLAKLELPAVKDLAIKLKDELKWQPETYDVAALLKLYDNEDIQQELFAPDNFEFIKKMCPYGSNIMTFQTFLKQDQPTRDLLVELMDTFDYHPQTAWAENNKLHHDEMHAKLLASASLKEGLFSEKTQYIVRELKEIDYYVFSPDDVEILINLPIDFPEFIRELKAISNYRLSGRDLVKLRELQENKEDVYQILQSISGSGYIFEVKDFEQLTPILGFADKMPALLSDLKEVLGYKFDIRDTIVLASLAEKDINTNRLVSLERIYERYEQEHDRKFGLQSIQGAQIIEANEDLIAELKQRFGHTFVLNETNSLQLLSDAPDRARVFVTLDALQNKLGVPLAMGDMSLYLSLSKISDLESKLNEAATLLSEGELSKRDNLLLFTRIGGELKLYGHAKEMLSDDYFQNIRDAKNRLKQFMGSVNRGEISGLLISKVFEVSTKATELDRLALKLGINLEIARAANNEAWQESFLQASNFQEANEELSKLMTELALPVVYEDLQGEAFTVKQNELLELASQDREFGDILEINCRSVGLYGKKYGNRGTEFATLLKGIREAIELNLERDPMAYAQKRALLSAHQFDRIFEGIPQEARERVMQIWLDLSSARSLRTSGKSIVSEEATLDRLNRIKDITQTDLSVHVQALFAEKIKALEIATEQGEGNGVVAEQLAIYKEYLLTPKGEIRQDIPKMYKSVKAFMRSGQQVLKDPNSTKEEKMQLGKSMGTYQAISDSLRALYKLGAINEKKYKTRKDYLLGINKYMSDFSGALKKLRILDPEKRATDLNMRALEEEVLLDFDKLRGTMAEENVSGQIVFETESTVAFRDLARAPEMTLSCQRLTEVTGYNQAAYSRLADGNNEMIDIYESRNGEKNRLARSFVELSRVTITDEVNSKLAILMDRMYVNPQYQNFSRVFSEEMVAHMIDRIDAAPEVSLLFSSDMFSFTARANGLLTQKGYQARRVSGEYFINESNIKLSKYYDSLGGITDVYQPSTRRFEGFYIIEKIT